MATHTGKTGKYLNILEEKKLTIFEIYFQYTLKIGKYTWNILEFRFKNEWPPRVSFPAITTVFRDLIHFKDFVAAKSIGSSMMINNFIFLG